MNGTVWVEAGLCLAFSVLLAGCGAKATVDPRAEAPPLAVVEQDQDVSLVKVDHPEQFPVATATAREAAPQLDVTGVISADVSRNVPVISLASGRVVEIGAKLGDSVNKGQLLIRIQSTDISTALSDYRKALASQVLTRAQLDRANTLHEKGAMAKKDLEIAQDAEAKAKVDVETTAERLRVLGADINQPSGVIDIDAPVSGVVTEQNVTASSGVRTLDNSPNLFTIADLSYVWILCDVYENDLSNVHTGEFVDVRLNAYPGRVLPARVSQIGPILDPNTRTAKVRLELRNPGFMRLGMFVTATFHGLQKQIRAVVPASAVLHLHDRDWVYVPAEGKTFHRVEVTGGNMLAGNMQEIVAGIAPGDRVVSNALVLQSTVEQ
jgi:cobalt-zinc-cadmium efflux system membrane fusion protein